ncbi:hypothetical protein E6O75_ATG05357 [Venturia nashicola]|uniref:Uncharacterized protein n=1 Tax=Venturia nashicola TaxID=86259 RepID=A0A4Z1NWQ5_9PEZI|nr:hypothetical protein E6O75_ATG05357 [Venturia nashicola]
MRESYTLPRNSFDSDQTLVNTAQPRRQASSQTSNRPSCKRSITTSTTISEHASDTAVSSQSKKKKVKTFLKRVGTGMLESLSYSAGAGNDFVATTRMDKRSNDEVLGDVYGVQLMIW